MCKFGIKIVKWYLLKLIKMKKIVLMSFFLTVIHLGYGQQDAAHIKTIILKPTTPNSFFPAVKLGEKIQLYFDDLNADEENYYYKVVHCNEDWDASNLLESEFVNGYAEDKIQEYENSFNTLQPYTNYKLTLPNNTTRLKISGNYLLVVSNSDGEVVFERRFIVYEPLVTVAAAVYRSRDISQINSKQSVEFTIDYTNFRINNPRDEIFPVLLQNNNWQFSVKGLKPQFYRGNQLLYKYNNETSFWAGNEFLYFDSKSIRNSSLNIEKSVLGTNLYHTYLYTNEERIDKPYTLFPDINGNFIVRNLDAQNNHTDADYSWVHFSLSCMENLDNKNIYVSGNFNNWQLNEDNKMTFNEDNGLYEAAILLKQGFYNYQFLTQDKNGNLSNHDIDGSFYQTENDYMVIVYYKKFGSRYTKVIGLGFANSEKINN